jgi:hypothetical protein
VLEHELYAEQFEDEQLKPAVSKMADNSVQDYASTDIR